MCCACYLCPILAKTCNLLTDFSKSPKCQILRIFILFDMRCCIADRTDKITLVWVFHNFSVSATDKAQRGFGIICRLIPVTTQPNSWLCGRSLVGIVGSNPAGNMEVCLF